MHNLVEECCITFNDLVAARFDSAHLDFWTAFTVPASKRVGYDNMIGNTTTLNFPSTQLNKSLLNLPLPFFYSRDSGVALPTAALPYNEMRITFRFRCLGGLLGYHAGVTSSLECVKQLITNVPANLGGGTITVDAEGLHQVQVWGNYAIVSNDERKRMACAPRDILIEQAQSVPSVDFVPKNNGATNVDIRFSHAVKVLFFAARNITHCCVRSNYTTLSPNPANFSYRTGSDPLLTTSLIYENTARLSAMGSDYYSLVNPYYSAPVIPSITGYHSYSYSLDFYALDPMGSTNYGKLTNVSIIPSASQGAVNAGATPTPNPGDGSVHQKYEFVCTCVNNNIIRVSGGALGFPVL